MSGYTSASDWCQPFYRDVYEVTKPLTWEIGVVGSGVAYTAHKGFKFDVTIPKVLRWAFDPHDQRFLKAACLHDHMLLNRWTRISSGAVFHDALKADGVSAMRRLVMWLAVSLWRYS